MKATIEKGKLLAALKVLKPITAKVKKGDTTIMAHVQITPQSGSLIIAATDGEQNLSLSVICDAQESMPPFLLPCVATIKALGNLPAGPVAISVDGGWAEISSPVGNMALPSPDPGLYPKAGTWPDDNGFSFHMKRQDLLTALQRTTPFVNGNETRKSIQGVAVGVNGDEVEFLSTNGHQAARYHLPVSDVEGEPRQVIIPLAAATALQSALKWSEIGDADMVGFTFGARDVLFSAGPVVMAARLIEAKFPNPDQIIPKDHSREVTVDVPALAAAMKAIAVSSPETIKPVCMSLKPGGMGLFSENSESGQVVRGLPAEYEGDDITVGLNAPYVLDVLKLAPRERVVIGLNDTLQATTWTFPSIPGFLAVVMPLRIEWEPPPDSFPDIPAKAAQPTPEASGGKSRPKAGKLKGAPNKPVPGHVLTLADYSAKAVIITGETYPHRERIKNAVPKAHGLFHRKTKGWIFSKKHRAALETALNDLLKSA